LTLIPQLHRALEEAGRDVDRFEVTIYFCPADREVVERCKELGVTRVLFGAPSVPADELLPALDELAEFIE
jgi:hypothetical protein